MGCADVHSQVGMVVKHDLVNLVPRADNESCILCTSVNNENTNLVLHVCSAVYENKILVKVLHIMHVDKSTCIAEGQTI